MTASELTATLKALDLTRAKTAQLLGMSERTVYHWAAGRTPIPVAVAAVLRLIRSGRISLDDVGGRYRARGTVTGVPREQSGLDLYRTCKR
jgi:hypothetical protein